MLLITCSPHDYERIVSLTSSTDDLDTVGSEAYGLGLTADLDAALTRVFIRSNDVAGDVGVVVRSDELPTPLVLDAMP